jgi:hypothetical protein
MAAPRMILFLRNEINQSLLLESERRVEIMNTIEDLKDKLSRLEGFNFFKEWEKLLDTITNAWQEDANMPFFKLEEQLLDKLAFFLDFIANFFLYNGSEEDNEFLKDVDEFFKQHKKVRGKGDSLELFKRAFKSN